MDIEQLKLVLETVKGITDDATSVAIWYMVLHYGGAILSNIMIIGGLLTAVYLVVKGFVTCNEDEAFITQLYSEVCGKDTGWLSSYERAEILKTIRELKSKDGHS